MIDSIRIEFEQEVKTVLGNGKGNFSEFFFLTGSIETILDYQKSFIEVCKKALAYMPKAGSFQLWKPMLDIYAASEENAVGSILMRIFYEDGDYYMVDSSTTTRDRVKTDKKQIIAGLKTLYEKYLYESDRERRIA